MSKRTGGKARRSPVRRAPSRGKLLADYWSDPTKPMAVGAGWAFLLMGAGYSPLAPEPGQPRGMYVFGPEARAAKIRITKPESK